MNEGQTADYLPCGDVIFHDDRGSYACDLDASHDGRHGRGSMTWIGTRNLATRPTPPTEHAAMCEYAMRRDRGATLDDCDCGARPTPSGEETTA